VGQQQPHPGDGIAEDTLVAPEALAAWEMAPEAQQDLVVPRRKLDSTTIGPSSNVICGAEIAAYREGRVARLGEPRREVVDVRPDAGGVHACESPRRFEVVADHDVSFAPTGIVGDEGGARLCGAGQGPHDIDAEGELSTDDAAWHSTPHNAGLGIISKIDPMLRQ
jgi:hypothetical protein